MMKMPPVLTDCVYWLKTFKLRWSVSLSCLILFFSHETQDFVEFVVNAPYSVILEWLSKASIGLSTMVDEHFGINVVEFMVSGMEA